MTLLLNPEIFKNAIKTSLYGTDYEKLTSPLLRHDFVSKVSYETVITLNPKFKVKNTQLREFTYFTFELAKMDLSFPLPQNIIEKILSFEEATYKEENYKFGVNSQKLENFLFDTFKNLYPVDNINFWPLLSGLSLIYSQKILTPEIKQIINKNKETVDLNKIAKKLINGIWRYEINASNFLLSILNSCYSTEELFEQDFPISDIQHNLAILEASPKMYIDLISKYKYENVQHLLKSTMELPTIKTKTKDVINTIYESFGIKKTKVNTSIIDKEKEKRAYVWEVEIKPDNIIANSDMTHEFLYGLNQVSLDLYCSNKLDIELLEIGDNIKIRIIEEDFSTFELKKNFILTVYSDTFYNLLEDDIKKKITTLKYDKNVKAMFDNIWNIINKEAVLNTLSNTQTKHSLKRKL